MSFFDTEKFKLTVPLLASLNAERKLGALEFPNGSCLEFEGQKPIISKFHVNLSDLYETLSGWKIKGESFPLHDVIAVIAFGSAVREPPMVTVTKRKYVLFGEKTTTVEQKKVLPSDADFLVITSQSLTGDKMLKPSKILVDNYGGYCIQKGGIHLVTRGIDQFIRGCTFDGDTVSSSAFFEGVAIIADQRFTDRFVKARTSFNTEGRMNWSHDTEGRLNGSIKALSELVENFDMPPPESLEEQQEIQPGPRL